MAKPTKGATRSKTNSRRAHHAMKPATARTCESCGKAVRPHRACPDCGKYRNRSVKAKASS